MSQQRQLNQPNYRYQNLSYQNYTKNPNTTKYTQKNSKFILSNSFVLGKNYLLQNNTESSLDSSDNQSQISFQERLNLCHQKKLTSQILKYFQLNNIYNPLQHIEKGIGVKSIGYVKQVEQKTFLQIKRLYGDNDVQKIKLVIKFIKRNQDSTKLYYQVLKVIPNDFQTLIFFLFKQSVMVYLEGRQYINENQFKISKVVIRDYLQKNNMKICEQIKKDEKFQQFFFNHNKNLKSIKFEQFIFTWMQGFFLLREGFPCEGYQNTQKFYLARNRLLEGDQQSDIRKKIKKY